MLSSAKFPTVGRLGSKWTTIILILNELSVVHLKCFGKIYKFTLSYFAQNISLWMPLFLLIEAKQSKRLPY